MGLKAFTLENHLGDEMRVERCDDGGIALVLITGRGMHRVTQLGGTPRPQPGSSVRLSVETGNGPRGARDRVRVYLDDEPVIVALDNIPTGLEGHELKAAWF